jgi:phosphate transport system substrate-binding protein
MTRKILVNGVLAAALSMGGACAQQVLINAAGATFPYPMYSKWFDEYHKKAGAQINYSSIGSGGGIAQVTAGTVDFGASDGPMTDQQIKAFQDKRGSAILHFPTVLGAVVPTYNIPGVTGSLDFTGEALAGIYLGKITKWNDPALKALNKGVNLPSTDITPIFRSDGSGTTYNFTDYLSNVSGDFAQKVGQGTAVNFPAGVGGRGSSGVSAVLSRTEGGIMYADVAFATVTNHFQTFLVQNKAGKFVAPGIAGAIASAATVTAKSIPADNSISIVNPPKSQKGAYPISTFTFVILPTKTDNAAALRKFVFWALTGGARLKTTSELLFAPMPHVVIIQAEKTLKKVQS